MELGNRCVSLNYIGKYLLVPKQKTNAGVPRMAAGGAAGGHCCQTITDPGSMATVDQERP